MPVDYDIIASELLRALRGRRSQRGFSALFGFRTNVAYRWEAGLRYPTITQLLGALERIGRPVQPALERIEAKVSELRDLPASSPEYPSALLRLHRGSRSITELASAAGLQRLQVSRMLSGRTQPRLPVYLRLLDTLHRAHRRVRGRLGGPAAGAPAPRAPRGAGGLAPAGLPKPAHRGPHRDPRVRRVPGPAGP